MDTNKAHALVEYLMRHERAVTAKELAGFLNFSVRSVKSYIAAINGEAREPLIVSGHSGYTVHPAAAREYLRATQQQSVPQDYEERANWINQKFLKYHVSRLNLYEVAEELNYSADTIRGDVRRMNGSFASFGIAYELHGNDICMLADEKSLRRLARYSFFEGSGDRIVSYDSIKSNLDDVDVEAIRGILERTLAGLNLYVNDFSLTNIVLHVSIVVSRVQSHHELPSEPCPEHRENDVICRAAQQICAELEKALHLHLSPEEQNNIYFLRIRTVLLCPRYLEFASRISNQLLIAFGDEIDLVACVEDPAALDRYRCELLITTVVLEGPPKNGAIVVSVPLLGIGKCKSEIEDALDSIRSARRIRVLKSNFDRIFSAELFSVNPEKNTDPAQIMKTMSQQMIEQGNVQEDFYQRLMEREQASSTGFPNIAIPHSMKMDAIRTSINVMLCPQGVVWGGNLVKIVMMVAIHKTDLRMFGDLYQALLELMDDSRSRETLLRSCSFEELRACILHWN